MRTTQTLTRRGLLGVGAAMPILAGLRLDVGSEANANDAPASSQPHGGGYYRFGIGGFKATVISDGYGSVPFWPIFAANQPESSTEAFLKENRLGPTPQFTNNVLVVDTPTDRVLVDTGFGDVLGPASGQFPWLVQNLGRAGIPTESITTVIITHVHLDHVAGIITKSGDHVFPNAKYVIVDDERRTGPATGLRPISTPRGHRRNSRKRQSTPPKPTCRRSSGECRSCAQAQMWLPASRFFPLPAIRPPTRLFASAQTTQSLFTWPTWLTARIQVFNTRNGPSFSISMASRRSQRESGFSARLLRTGLW